MIYLQNDSFVDGKLGDDVREKQVAVVLGGRVNAHLGQQTRPCKRHQPTQLVALLPATTSSTSSLTTVLRPLYTGQPALAGTSS